MRWCRFSCLRQLNPPDTLGNLDLQGACTSSPSQANGAITSAPSTNFLQQTTGKFRAAIVRAGPALTSCAAGSNDFLLAAAQSQQARGGVSDPCELTNETSHACRLRKLQEKGDAKRRVAVHASKLPNKFNKETECCERLLPTDGGPPAPKARRRPRSSYIYETLLRFPC